MAESRYTWERGVRADYAQRKREAYAQRDERTHDISLAWKEGFARLKQENDRMQLERDQEFKTTLASLEASLRQTLATGYTQY